MKIKLLLFSFLFTSYYCVGQVVAGHLDNFEDGTVQGWNIDLFGAGAPNPPININTGGPAGVDDNFLQYTTTGNPGGPGSNQARQSVTGASWPRTTTRAAGPRLGSSVVAK